MVRGNARDLTVPPSASPDFAFLARHLKYGRDIDALESDLSNTLIEVNQLVEVLLADW